MSVLPRTIGNIVWSQRPRPLHLKTCGMRADDDVFVVWATEVPETIRRPSNVKWVFAY